MMILYIIILYIIGIIMNTFSSIYAKNKAISRLKNPYESLPDIIHDIFPVIPLFIPDIFLLFSIGLVLYYNNSLIDVQNNIICTGICLILRSLTVGLTILPSCVPNIEKKNKTLYSRLFHSSHDLMFSGHTLFFICIGRMLQNIWIQIFGPFLLIISRQHYTIDVIVSGLVYFVVYCNIFK